MGNKILKNDCKLQTNQSVKNFTNLPPKPAINSRISVGFAFHVAHASLTGRLGTRWLCETTTMCSSSLPAGNSLGRRLILGQKRKGLSGDEHDDSLEPKWSKFMPNFMRVANDLCDRRIAIAKKDMCVDSTWPQDK